MVRRLLAAQPELTTEPGERRSSRPAGQLAGVDMSALAFSGRPPVLGDDLRNDTSIVPFRSFPLLR